MDPASDVTPRGAAPGPAMQRLWWAAGLWAVSVMGATSWLIHHALDAHRQAQLDTAELRLESLHETLDTSFNQLAALPRALSRQSPTISFLQGTRAEGSEQASEADRPRLRKSLSAQAPVQTVSRALRDTAHEFKVTQIYLLDRYGTALADSGIDTATTFLGANYRARRYYTDAIEGGSGSQFAVGSIYAIPSFYFSARVGTPDEPLGVLVLKQECAALSQMLNDHSRRLFVTDANGVLLMSNRSADILGRSPLQGPMAISLDAQTRLYRTPPKSLPWLDQTIDIKGQHIARIRLEDGQYYFARSRPLSYGSLTAWVLTPQEGEATLIAAWSTGAALLLISGWGVLLVQDQRRKRLHAVMRAQQMLTHMAHALPLTVFRYETRPGEPEGRFTFIGQGLRPLLGIELEGLREDPTHVWRLLRTPDKLPPLMACEVSLAHSGRHVWIRSESQCTTEADGTRIYNGYWADITAQHLLGEQLQSVFVNSPLAFVYYDATLSVTRCNAAALALFGAQSQSELLGLKPHRPPMSAPMDEATLVQRREGFLDKIQRGEVVRFEWQYTRLDGNPFDADVVAIPFVVDGQTLECAIIQDITARKASEAAIRQAQQAAEAATQAKSQFLANMSHEIRTPMNAVMGMIHLALMDELTPKARNYLDKAHRAAGNLLQILNDVLDVSKIEAGKMALEQTPFQLEDVVRHMADVLGMRAEEKTLELLFTAPPDIPTALIGDPTRLGQILLNLGNNAIKFTEHGEILIGCEVQQRDPAEVVLHFWVKDTGIGMCEDQIARLFQPFTQGDSSTTRQYGGTGLGLNISRQLVELMHGRIWADSLPGKGSSFHFTARFGVQAEPAATRALLASELQGTRVLLVDDNATAREVLGDMTRRLGLQVDVAESGEHALAVMKQAQAEGKPHQLLLADWKMPGMDGIRFAREALAQQAHERPSVLLVTAFARDEALKAAQGVPLAGVINKPVTPSTLHDALAHALAHEEPTPLSTRDTRRALQQAQQKLAGARVLLVEDQAMNQELACDLLERAGMCVVTASNGQECLAKLAAQGPFDAVLMDCQMPVMDGYTATRRIRAQPQWQALPIIAMTASALAADRDRVLACGMNDHITKPLDLGQMFTIMARWISPSAPMQRDLAATADAATGTGSLSHLDTADGLSRCMGSMSLYQRLLKGFAKTQRDFAQDYAAAPDRRAALMTVHTLKGLAGNIGATRLYQAVTQLEASMQTPIADETTEQQARLNASLAMSLDALQAVLADIDRLNSPRAEPTEQPTSMLQDDALQTHLRQLSTLINDSDAHARELLYEVMLGRPALSQHPKIQALKQALERYDFDAAAHTLREVSN